MFRVIQGCKPRWVIAENVTGLINIKGGVLFEQVQTDLESEGYSVQPIVLPAASKNAPHRRDRIWIIGRLNTHTNSNSESNDSNYEYERQRKLGSSIIAHTRRKHGSKGNATELDEKQTKWASRTVYAESSCERQSDSTETDSQRLQRQRRKSEPVSQCETKHSIRGGGEKVRTAKSWKSQSSLCGVDDGLPTRLDRFDGWDREPGDIPRVATGIKNRTERLKSLGNSIVPQVVAEIFRAIKETEQ
jgi:DNA (cytosine-5)-methyltransferase 1